MHALTAATFPTIALGVVVGLALIMFGVALYGRAADRRWRRRQQVDNQLARIEHIATAAARRRVADSQRRPIASGARFTR